MRTLGKWYNEPGVNEQETAQEWGRQVVTRTDCGAGSMNQAFPRNGKWFGRQALPPDWQRTDFSSSFCKTIGFLEKKNLKSKSLSSNQASRVWDELPTAEIFRPLLFLFVLAASGLTNIFIPFPVDCDQATYVYKAKCSGKSEVTLCISIRTYITRE